MANQDYMGAMKDMMSNVDASSMGNLFKSQSALAEKMAAVALDAAQKSTELTAKWTHDTLSKMQAASGAKAEPADYAKSVTNFMSGSAESAAEHMAAFAEIAKRVQTETLELMLAAGRDMTEDMTAAAKKATSGSTDA